MAADLQSKAPEAHLAWDTCSAGSCQPAGRTGTPPDTTLHASLFVGSSGTAANAVSSEISSAAAQHVLTETHTAHQTYRYRMKIICEPAPQAAQSRSSLAAKQSAGRATTQQNLKQTGRGGARSEKPVLSRLTLFSSPSSTPTRRSENAVMCIERCLRAKLKRQSAWLPW
jgi:hypothetical protein